MQIIVVGAGIVGASLALRLAQRGAEVTLVEAREPGIGTTGTSFAWIDASHPSLAPYVELNVAGLDAWRRLGAELGHPWWLALTGTLTWEVEPDRAAALSERMERLTELGHDGRRLTAAQAQALEPDVIVDPAAALTVYFPDEGHLFPQPALGGLLEAGRQAGVRLCRGHEALEFDSRYGHVTGVVLDGGKRITGDMTVTCVGRWTEDLLAPAGVEVPLVRAETHESAAVGLLVSTSPVLTRLDRVVFADGLMTRPEGGGRLLLHSDAIDARVRHDTATDPVPVEADELLELARARLRHAEAARVESVRVGIRALPRDRKPVVGPVRDGLYVVVTHSGITLAPAIGELVAGELLDGQPAGALAAFRPPRGPGVAP